MTGFLKRAFGGAAPSIGGRHEMKEAVAYFIVLMIHADGDVERDEVDIALSSMARCRLFADNSRDDDLELLTRMERKMRDDAEGHAERYARILAQDGWNRSAVAILADIMLADGASSPDELHLLSQLGARAAMTPPQVDEVVRTVGALRRAWS